MNKILLVDGSCSQLSPVRLDFVPREQTSLSEPSLNILLLGENLLQCLIDNSFHHCILVKLSTCIFRSAMPVVGPDLNLLLERTKYLVKRLQDMCHIWPKKRAISFEKNIFMFKSSQECRNYL